MDAIHISRLRLMAKSAAHFAHGFTEETYAMERGTAVDRLIFETGQIIAWPEGKQRRGKEYDAFVKENPNAIVLTHTEGQKALAMAEAVRKCPEATRALQGHRQQQIAWRIGNRDAAGTPDVVGDRFVTELKTCMTSDPVRFQRHSLKMGYHAQLAWYMDGLMLTGVTGIEAAYIVAVESAAPYPVTVFRLQDRAIEQGRKMYRLWWERMLVCEASGVWPPYAQGVVALDVPDDEPEIDFGDEAAA